jgi:hypothetical protein
MVKSGLCPGPISVRLEAIGEEGFEGTLLFISVSITIRQVQSCKAGHCIIRKKKKREEQGVPTGIV